MTDTTTEQTTETRDDNGSADQTNSPPADGGKGRASAAAAAKAALDAGKSASGGGDEKPWYDGLPDDLKAEKSLLRHASLEDAMRAAIGAEKRLGVPADQLIRLPTSDDETKALYVKLGAPEKPEGYNIGLPDGATDEDKAAAASFAKHMHEQGPFPPAFVKAAVDWNNQQAAAAAEAQKAADDELNAAGTALLKQELGAAYDPDMKAVGQMLHALGGKELAAEFDATRAGSNPRLMLALNQIALERQEPGTLEGGNGGTGGGLPMTPAAAKSARIALENDPIKGVALRDAAHPMHKSVVQERDRLFAFEGGRDPDKAA